MPSPNEELARRVAARLAEAGVVPRAGADALAERLARGAVTRRDWEALLDGQTLGGAPSSGLPF